MKKIILIILPILLTACSLEKNDNKLEEKKNIVPENNIIEEQEPIYQDSNPVEIGLYVENATGGLDLVKDEYHTTWVMKKDIVVFGSLLTHDESKEFDYYQYIWADAASKYADINYKVAWQVEFNLKNGESIKQIIYKPSDVQYFYDYLEIYLYDSANVPINTWYSHLLDEQMTNDTIMTSMKLTAGSKYEEIEGPIKVMVFTYDSEDDFDENGSYRGISKYNVTVYND